MWRIRFRSRRGRLKVESGEWKMLARLTETGKIENGKLLDILISIFDFLSPPTPAAIEVACRLIDVSEDDEPFVLHHHPY